MSVKTTTWLGMAGWGLLAVLVGPAGAAEVAIGVAPFESVAPEGKVVPDIASRLAQRLGTSGIEKVVGPAQLGLPAVSEPETEEVTARGAAAEVGAIVVGRTTRLGNTLSVDARILDAATGAAVGGPMVEEVARPADLGRAIEGLAAQVVARIEADPLRASTPKPKPDRDVASPAPAERGRPFSSNSPIAIKADELEAEDSGSRKKFIFTGHVRATQDDLVVKSDRLEAFYPPGSSQPERLVATGHVVLEQTGRTAYCEKAVFFRSDDRMVCTGQTARLEQACDIVRGETITFHLDTEVLHVQGAADVQLRPEDPSCAAAGGGTGR